MEFEEDVDELNNSDPAALASLGLTRDTAIRKLAFDKCQAQAKLFGDVNRFRQAQVQDEKYLMKEIRSLSNGGIPFNPYL